MSKLKSRIFIHCFYQGIIQQLTFGDKLEVEGITIAVGPVVIPQLIK